MFVYQSRFLKRGEVWFDNEPTDAAVDWILYRNRSQPVPGVRWRNFYNRLIDLRKTPEQLLTEMDPKTVAKIKSAAEQDHVRYQHCDLEDGRILQELERIWNESIEAKRRWGMLNRQWLREMLKARAFELFAARESSGAPLVFAGMYRDRHRVQQLMSVSPPRQALIPANRARTNRASCFLLWSAMLELKAEGIQTFDFGGWYPGTEDIQLLGANTYKRGFGGEVVLEYECEQILTLKAWVVLNSARLLAQARQFQVRKLLHWDSNPNVAPA